MYYIIFTYEKAMLAHVSSMHRKLLEDYISHLPSSGRGGFLGPPQKVVLTGVAGSQMDSVFYLESSSHPWKQ